MKKAALPKPTNTDNIADYRSAFGKRVHQLLKLGYEQMKNPAKLAKAEEEEITGELVQAIDNVLDDPPPAINAWADHFFAQEERRVNQNGKSGKRRSRLDITIHSSQTQPRARFSFESKRLGKGNGVAKYLGSEGLGAFVSGFYASADLDAGMLGYVQADSETSWATKIQATLAATPIQYGYDITNRRAQVSFVSGLSYSYSSNHRRQGSLGSIRIFHTLLRFCK